MAIVEYNNAKDIMVEFEDGAQTHTSYECFLLGKVHHPSKYNRLGETNINKKGQKMTIITYRSSTNIDVQFDDGTIVRHKEYNAFKNGRIRNPNSKVGEKNNNFQGLEMTLIIYKNMKDITVQFENNYIVEHTTYKKFISGDIYNPYKFNVVGKTNVNMHGLNMTIILFKNIHNISVQFEDGYVVDHITLEDFCNGKVKHPYLRKELGMTNVNSQGLNMTIIIFKNKQDITVKFDDGYVKEHTTYKQFIDGTIKHPYYSDKVGQTILNKNGLSMAIISVKTLNDIMVKFEDGYIVEHTTYDKFINGTIKHPYHSSRLGETNIHKNGLKMQIIVYRNSNDITVKFEDGFIIEHTTYNQFCFGSVYHPNYHSPRKYNIGDTFINAGGYEFTIIDIKDKGRVDVKYKDGTMFNNVVLSNEKKRKILHKNTNHNYLKNKKFYEGKVFFDSHDERFIIKKYYKYSKVEIQFDDGTTKFVNIQNILNKNIAKEKVSTSRDKINRIGATNIAHNGLAMTIVDYINSGNIVVEFEDGTKVHTQYNSFKNGNVKHPNIKSKRTKKHYIGEEFVNKGGYKFKIINIQENNQYDVQYENGIIKEKIQLNNEKNRKNCP